MKRGFTLVELLVVVGIMGTLATVSTVGYYAASRGMTDRGARQDVVSFLRQAQQRALANNRPVAVFVTNERLVEDTGLGGSMVRGKMVAVQLEGRISYLANNVLVDEFADWRRNYEVYTKKDSKADSTMRLYRLVAKSSKLDTKYYSDVSDYVMTVDWKSEYLLGTLGTESDMNNGRFTLPSSFSDQTGFDGVARPVGFVVESGGSAAFADWKVGDAYGMEFASFTLPNNYVFGTKMPSQVGVQDVDSLLFDPATVSPNKKEFEGTVNVQLRAYRPGSSSPESVGNAITKNDLKD